MKLRRQIPLVLFFSILIIGISITPQTLGQEEAEPLFTLKYLFDTAEKGARDLGTLLKIEYAKIGIELELVGMEAATVDSRIWGLEGWPTYPTHDEGGFDLTYMGYWWIPTDLVYFIGCYNTEGIPFLGWNFWAAHDGRADIYLREAMATYDHEERLESIFKWQDQKQEEVNEIQLAHSMVAFMADIKLKMPGTPSLIQIDRWYVEGKTHEDFVTIKQSVPTDPAMFLVMFADGGFPTLLPLNRMLFRMSLNQETGQYFIEPELVTDWEYSEDGMSMTLTLREDAYFTDGVQMTSADVKWTFDTILDTDTGSTYWGDFSAAIESVEAPGTYTVILNFKKPSPEILTLLCPTGGYPSIMPKHVLEDIPHDQLRTCDYNTKAPPPGLGPMKFVEWKEGEYVKLEAYDDYYGGRIFVDELINIVIPEPGTALAALEAHETDILYGMEETLSGEITRLQAKPDINAEYYGAIMVQFIPINNDHPILGNKYVRQALAYATPYDKVINDVFMGAAIPANSPIHPAMWSWNPETKYYTYDLDKARECLTKAGYPDWPPPPPEEIPMSAYLTPALGGLIGGIVIGIAAMYILNKRRMS